MLLLKLVGFCVLLASAATALPDRAQFLDDFSGVSENAFAQLIQMAGGPANAAVSDYFCDLSHLNAIQYGFNEALGLNTSLNWKNSINLYTQVDVLLAQNQAMYQKVCRARKNFYNGMGATYTDCTNPLFLAGHLGPGGNLSLAYTYAAMWTQLDFVCNGGLFIGLQSYGDLMKVYGTPAGIACYTAFLNGINDPYNICGTVNTYMTCLQGAYVAFASNHPNGWWICERLRVGYAPYCLNLRCIVSS